MGKGLYCWRCLGLVIQATLVSSHYYSFWIVDLAASKSTCLTTLLCVLHLGIDGGSGGGGAFEFLPQQRKKGQALPAHFGTDLQMSGCGGQGPQNNEWQENIWMAPGYVHHLIQEVTVSLMQRTNGSLKMLDVGGSREPLGILEAGSRRCFPSTIFLTFNPAKHLKL